jgi:hypothetical protein
MASAASELSIESQQFIAAPPFAQSVFSLFSRIVFSPAQLSKCCAKSGFLALANQALVAQWEEVLFTGPASCSPGQRHV